MADLQAVLARNPACPAREIQDGFVVMAADGRTTHPLDGVAAFIWRQLDGRRDLAAVRDGLIAEFEVETAEAEADLLAFVGQMVEAGLVIRPDDGKPSYDRFRDRIMFPIRDRRGRSLLRRDRRRFGRRRCGRYCHWVCGQRHPF